MRARRAEGGSRDGARRWTVPDDTLVDFAVVAFREEGQWQMGALPHRAAADLDALVAALRQQPSEGPSFALCSYGDDFFLVLRPDHDEMRVMVSDVTAVGEWPIARDALELIGEDTSGADDFDHVAPAGDLEIFSDLGLDSMELVAICSDLELYPDEMLAQIAARIGFGPQFDSVVDDDLT
jgi:putative tRNA adenosine deaminase-associated protein